MGEEAGSLVIFPRTQSGHLSFLPSSQRRRQRLRERQGHVASEGQNSSLSKLRFPVLRWVCECVCVRKGLIPSSTLTRECHGVGAGGGWAGGWRGRGGSVSVTRSKCRALGGVPLCLGISPGWGFIQTRGKSPPTVLGEEVGSPQSVHRCSREY